MTTINLEIPSEIKEKLWIGNKISYYDLIEKTIWEDYISPELKFISYVDLSEEDKKMYDESDILDRSKFTNI